MASQNHTTTRIPTCSKEPRVYHGHRSTGLLEKEILNERLQLLQLCFYISETHLKAFEDALEQHVQAVANNTAPTLPERQQLRCPEDQATSATTPMLS
jgi:hypothetical protein